MSIFDNILGGPEMAIGIPARTLKEAEDAAAVFTHARATVATKPLARQQELESCIDEISEAMYNVAKAHHLTIMEFYMLTVATQEGAMDAAKAWLLRTNQMDLVREMYKEYQDAVKAQVKASGMVGEA